VIPPSQAFSNFANYWQRQGEINQARQLEIYRSLQLQQMMLQMNKPKTGYGIIYTPSGGFYQYDYHEY
jgi:hypothetical protein